jgi:6-phosphogluconate dehydrogenase (decarboxylating)
MSGASQTSSGFNQLQSSHISSPASSSLLDLGPSPAHQAPQTTPAPTASAGDDEWTFTSALPEDVPIAVLNSSVKIEFSPRRNPGDNNIHVAALFSNTTAQPINELHFQLAIEKV